MSTESSSILVVIPARGGSKGIPRKNLRTLNGAPLLAYAIRMALSSKHSPRVVVTSDDLEILSIAGRLGAQTHRRPVELADDKTTLDSVIHDAVLSTPGQFSIVATVQPTSPLLRTTSFDEALDRMLEDRDIETIISAIDDRHLRWTSNAAGTMIPAYAERVNRQEMAPSFRETGGFLITRAHLVSPSSRIGKRVSLAVLSGPEGIDIDTPDDFALCEWHLSRRHVLFVVTGYPEVGLGHVFNSLTIANELMRYDVSFLVDHKSELARSVIGAHNYPVHRQRESDIVADILALAPDAVINDRLDTSTEYMKRLKSVVKTVINVEDLGSGAVLADLVINAIYPEEADRAGHYSGARFFCLRPEFMLTQPRSVTREVRRVLITFGGTDPSDLTRKVVESIGAESKRRGIEVTAILGMGYAHDVPPDVDRLLRSVPNMSDEMQRADLIFTSAGRTVFEVASVGTPAIVLAQNQRELTHTFAAPLNGFVNLGLGTGMTREEVCAEYCRLLDDPDRRATMQRQMLATDLRQGVERVVKLIRQTIDAA